MIFPFLRSSAGCCSAVYIGEAILTWDLIAVSVHSTRSTIPAPSPTASRPPIYGPSGPRQVQGAKISPPRDLPDLGARVLFSRGKGAPRLRPRYSSTPPDPLLLLSATHPTRSIVSGALQTPSFPSLHRYRHSQKTHIIRTAST